MFFLEENGAYATVNKFEAKMLTATFKDGDLYDLNYFEEVKSDAYPVVQLRKDERILKGFEWLPDKRPKGPEDVTSHVPRETERERYEKISRPVFRYTDEYFPGYLQELDKNLREAEQQKRARQEEQRRLREEAELEQQATELAEAENQAEEVQPSEEIDQSEQQVPVQNAVSEIPAGGDTLVLDSNQIDSLLAGQTIDALKSKIPVDPKIEQKAKQRAEREAKKASKEKARQEKLSRKEEKWAALDARDAEKAAKKAAKLQEKQRIKMEKMLKARAKREEKEQRILESYKEKFEKRKARKESR